MGVDMPQSDTSYTTYRIDFTFVILAVLPVRDIPTVQIIPRITLP